nr:hypothetical protein [Tanacetum cinerariifolium]
MDKRKRFKLTLEISRDIIKIFPRVQGQDFDALTTDEEIVSFLSELGHSREINSLNDVVVHHMLKPWRTFVALINSSLSGKTTCLDKLLPMDEKPKSTKKKVPAKKTARKQTSGVVIRDTYKESSSKREEKVDVASGKGIELLSEVALTEEAQYREVRKKSLRDFHKTHPSGSGTVTKIVPSGTKIKPSLTNKETGVKPRVPDVTKKYQLKVNLNLRERTKMTTIMNRSKGGDQERDSDDDNTQSDSEKGLDSELETDENESITDKAEGDEDEEMDFATSKLYDDVDMRLNKPVQANDEIVQKEGTNDEMINKTKVPVTSSSYSSDLAAKFLNFANIPTIKAKSVSPMDVHVHHEVPSKKTPTLLTVPVSVITESSPIYSTIILQSISSFTPPLPQSTPTLPPTTEATNPLSILLDFIPVFQFDNRFIALEKEVVKLKKDDPLKTQVTTLVDENIDARLGAARDEFMNYLSASITTRIIEQSSYEVVASLIEFELKKILIDKTDKSESYLAAPEHRECYDGLIKSYDLDKSLFSTYDKVYSLKRSQKDKYKDEDPFARSDRRLKKRKTSKDAEPTKENSNNDDDEPKGKVASKRDCFTKPEQHQEPTDPDCNDEKTPQQEPTQSWKKDPYTPYQDPQGFIYVDTLERNRLMRSDELYKFSDGTLTRLQTSLEDITKNIHMEYLPKRIWSTLENKRANIMIKEIDKQLKERRMMRSLKKFIGERHYGTEL